MEKIADYGTYTDGMRKSMTDKTWFLNMIDGAKEIVDYGCADGALLEYIRDAMPGVFDLTGIDIDEKMLHLAADRLNDGSHEPVILTQPEPFKDICGETVYDACLNWRDVIHYLLKYRYITNWDREMRENYLPLLTEEILLKIPSSYRVKYYEHYTLPYLKDQVMNDFGIDLNTKTHYKLLLERVD